MTPTSARALHLLVCGLTPDLHTHDQDMPGIYPATVPEGTADDAAVQAVIDAFYVAHRPRHPDHFCYQVFEGTCLLQGPPASRCSNTPGVFLGARQIRPH